MSKIYQITITEEQLHLIANSVELVHRAVCGQFTPLFDEVQYKNQEIKINDKIEKECSYEEMLVLEQMCQEKLITSSTKMWAGSANPLAYQTYRDILEYLHKNTKNVYSHVVKHETGVPKMIIEEIKKI